MICGNINLAVERIFFIDFFVDGTALKRFKRRSGDNISIDGFLFDEVPAWIGDKLGVGITFNRLGVNERRLRSAVLYGDKYIFGIVTGNNGHNGDNGEFGMWTLLYSDIFFAENQINKNSKKKSIINNQTKKNSKHTRFILN